MKLVIILLTCMVHNFVSGSKSSNPCDGDPVVFVPESFEQPMDNRECDEMFHKNPSKTTYFGGYNVGGSITTRCSLISKTCKRTCKAGPSCGCGNTYGLSKARDVCISLGASYGVVEGSAELCYQFQESFQCKSGDCERCKFYACAKTAMTKWQCSTYVSGSNKIRKDIVTKTNASIEGYVDRCEKDGTCAAECCDKSKQPTSFPAGAPYSYSAKQHSKMNNITKVPNGETLQDVSVTTSKFDFSPSSLMGTCQHILTMKDDAAISNATNLVSNTLIYTNGKQISATFQAEDVDCSQVLQPKNKLGIFDLIGFNFRH